MKRRKDGSYTLYCFSPPVMLATFVIEAMLALYVLLLYKGPVMRLIVLLLICLAGFQLAEFQNCEGSELTKLAWTKFGLVGISFLPALGVHLAGILTKPSKLIWVGYLLAIGFSAAFVLMPQGTAGSYCQGNYVLVDIPNPILNNLYSAYYFGFIMLGMAQLLLGIKMSRSKKVKQSNRSRWWFLAGYLAFTVPMAIVAQLIPSARVGTPSIMCGFAVLLALALALRVAPLSAEKAKTIRFKQHLLGLLRAS